MRTKRYLYSIIGSLLGQFITIVCGIILPRVLIRQYGSEIYGATTSITNFLGYITLLEGGIGGVARAALYKPLADKNYNEISQVISYIKYFFRMIAFIFSMYALFLACGYKFIARKNTLDWMFTFALVIVIALSSLAQYYFGIAYTILLQADQKIYLTKILDSAALLINTIVSCLLVFCGVNMIVLKLVWCGIHVIRIAILNIYIKRKYNLQKMKAQKDYLPEKWDGLGQHLAYFLHSHTDVLVLTVFVNLSEVAVYTVYNYIATSLNTLILALGANMEALFGDMLAHNEKNNLNRFFDYIEFIINIAVVVGFSVAMGLILPFVAIYTFDITDANYYRPMLAYFMLLSQVMYCIRTPYHQLTIAAGHFKRTRNAAFIEAGMNLGLSCLLGVRFGTEGVIIATLISIGYRTAYYVKYIEKNILYRSQKKFLKRLFVTTVNIGVNVFICQMLLPYIGVIDFWGKWLCIAILFTFLSLSTTMFISYICYKKECIVLLNKIKGISQNRLR